MLRSSSRPLGAAELEQRRGPGVRTIRSAPSTLSVPQTMVEGPAVELVAGAPAGAHHVLDEAALALVPLKVVVVPAEDDAGMARQRFQNGLRSGAPPYAPSL